MVCMSCGVPLYMRQEAPGDVFATAMSCYTWPCRVRSVTEPPRMDLQKKQQRADSILTRKILETAGSESNECAQATSLAEAIRQHCLVEKTSFHTPGHKARASACAGLPSWFSPAHGDLTELPGLDDFTQPAGALQRLAGSIARLWGARESHLSVNGASAALTAAILSTAVPGRKVLLPANCHRSAVNALVLSGLEPLWYDAVWDEQWGVWTGPDAGSFKRLLCERFAELSAAVVLNVDYCGAVTDVSSYARLCRDVGVPLIVDESHGAHRLGDSALRCGADMVVHSLHKTLGAMTQTGVLHVSNQCNVPAGRVKSALNLIHSSSPSYVLLSSIEQAVSDCDYLKDKVTRVIQLSCELRDCLTEHGAQVFQCDKTDELHLLFRLPYMDAKELAQALRNFGIYVETVLGNGVLLLTGVGTTVEDISRTKEAIGEICRQTATKTKSETRRRPTSAEQVFSPREAWFMADEIISVDKAPGRIASECLAPCPPGTPVLCPGQRVPADISTQLPELRWLRVVIES